MRAIFVLFAVIMVLIWLGFMLRQSEPAWSRTCYILAVFVSLLLGGAFFGLYGA